MTAETPSPAPGAPTYCARHADVETGLSCGRCGTPICPRCLVYTPAGTRCPVCATVGRPRMYVMGAVDYAKAIVTAIIIGPALGFLGAVLLPPRFSLGILTILLGALGGYAAGSIIARALDLTTGRKRGREVQIIAVAAVLIAAIGRLLLVGAPLEFALRDLSGLAMVVVAISAATTRLR